MRINLNLCVGFLVLVPSRLTSLFRRILVSFFAFEGHNTMQDDFIRPLQHS